MKAVTERVRRSERLTSSEHDAYEALIKTFLTKIDAAAYFGFSVVTMDAILLKGQGAPDSIAKIRGMLNIAA